MINELNYYDFIKFRNFLLMYPPSTDLKKLFFDIDQEIISNAKHVDTIFNYKKIIDTNYKHKDWYPILKKSNAIGSLFNQLENICVLDRDSLI